MNDFIPHFVTVSFQFVRRRAFSSRPSQNEEIAIPPAPEGAAAVPPLPPAVAAAPASPSPARNARNSSSRSRIQQIRNFFVLDETQIESDYALKIISDEASQVGQFVDLSEEKECPICLGTLCFSSKSDAISISNSSSAAQDLPPASPTSASQQQQFDAMLLGQRKIALCPHSRNPRNGKYLHGMCLACAQQLFTTTHSADLCDCPSCRKPISLVLTDDFSEDSSLAKVYKEERRKHYFYIFIRSFEGPLVLARFLGRPQSFRLELKRAILGEFFYTPLVVSVGIASFLAAWFVSGKFFQISNWISKKLFRKSPPPSPLPLPSSSDPSSADPEQQQNQQQNQQEQQQIQQLLDEDAAVENSNQEKLMFLIGLVFGFFGGIIMPSKILNRISGMNSLTTTATAIPSRTLAQQVCLDLLGSLTIYRSKLAARNLLREKCFSRPRSQMAKSKRALDNLAQIASLSVRIFAPVLSVAVLDALSSVL